MSAPSTARLSWAAPQYYPMRCWECDWVGMSDETDGGQPLADTGDTTDLLCPACGSDHVLPASEDDVVQSAYELYRAGLSCILLDGADAPRKGVSMCRKAQAIMLRLPQPLRQRLWETLDTHSKTLKDRS